MPALPCSQAAFRKAPPTGNRNASQRGGQSRSVGDFQRTAARISDLRLLRTHTLTHTVKYVSEAWADEVDIYVETVVKEATV